MQLSEVFGALGLSQTLEGVHVGNRSMHGTGPGFDVLSPIDGSLLAKSGSASAEEASSVIQQAHSAFLSLRQVPAPVRGEFVRQYAVLLREHKAALGALVSWEVGKITQEGEGEVQEMIDICDFAVGLSRQLYGKVIASERPEHRLTEQWHPLGAVGIISAFNFPVAVWAWNAALAWVCGDPVVWKPSEKAPLCAVACHSLAIQAASSFPQIPAEISNVLIGGKAVGEALTCSPLLPLISATGSVRMGREVGTQVAQRLGRSLLELGGNNAMLVAPSADLDLALHAIVFAAVGTAGQRCTSLRRLIVHESLMPELVKRLKTAYGSLKIGDPMGAGTLMGPLIDEASFEKMQAALKQAEKEGGKIHGGERLQSDVPAGGAYVSPAIVELDGPTPITQEETFAPILYVMPYKELSQAIAWNNNVPQGLSSAIFTNDVREAELFCSATGSDCGIVNVNIGTSGAEIGGAFGGEKDTGGGRESGSDSWKAYMRRATNTTNYGTALPLAQGIKFDI